MAALNIKAAAFLSPKRNDDDHALTIMAAFGGSPRAARGITTKNDKTPTTTQSPRTPGPHYAHEYELYDYIKALNSSFTPVCVLQTGAFCCLCEPSPYSGAFHKNFFPLAVAKIASLALLRRTGGEHHHAPVRREGR